MASSVGFRLKIDSRDGPKYFTKSHALCLYESLQFVSRCSMHSFIECFGGHGDLLGIMKMSNLIGAYVEEACSCVLSTCCKTDLIVKSEFVGYMAPLSLMMQRLKP